MTTKVYEYSVTTEENGSFSGSISIDGKKVIYQPHKPDTSAWDSIEEVTAWCEEHIEQLKSFDQKNAELEAQKITDSQRLANLETLLTEIHAKLNL